MKSIKHNLTFVTELDEKNPTAKKLLRMSETDQIKFLESMLKEMLAPRIQPVLDILNEGGTWAVVKVAD